MKWVLAVDFGSLGVIPTFARFNSDSWDIVVGVDGATVYGTKEEALKDASLDTSNLCTPMKLKNAQLLVNQWEADGSVMQTRVLKNELVSRKYNPDTDSKLDVLNWWKQYSMSPEGEVSYSDYESWPQLYSVFEHLWETQRYYSSSEHDGMEHGVSIYVKRDSKFETFKEELDLVLDFITHIDEDGFKIIGVFDHYLSEYGNSVTLRYNDETGVARIEGRYSSHMEGVTLEKAFDYLRKERYYE